MLNFVNKGQDGAQQFAAKYVALQGKIYSCSKILIVFNMHVPCFKSNLDHGAWISNTDLNIIAPNPFIVGI
jgi:hypothetical protein